MKQHWDEQELVEFCARPDLEKKIPNQRIERDGLGGSDSAEVCSNRG